MKKNILIINQYASTPEAGIGGRHYYMAREMAKQGHNVCVVAASYTHILRHPFECDDPYTIQQADGFDFIWVRVSKYDNAHSKKRIFNWFMFAWKLYGLRKVLPNRPDVVLCSSPSLVSFLGARRLASYFGARLSFEVRDIWPLTFVDVGGFSPAHPFIRFLQWVEDWAYRDSVRVVSNLKYAVNHMVSRGMQKEKFAWIPNGFSLTEISQAQELPNSIVNKVPEDKFIIGYAGTIGEANALDILIDAAKMLKNQTDIAFVIVGDGREKNNLVDVVKSNKLHNVVFINSIPKVQIQSMLSLFDVCFIGWRKEPLYRFGIAANKIFDYFWAGKPILHSYSGECDPVLDANAGFQVPAENPEEIAKAIMTLYQMPKSKREVVGLNGRNYAIENHDYNALAGKLAEVLVGES